MTDPDDIETRIAEIEAVIERLEAGELSLAEATEQYEVAMEEIEALREELAVGDGHVTETAAESPPSDTDTSK